MLAVARSHSRFASAVVARFVPLLQVARGIMWFNVVTVGVAFFYFIKRKASDVVPTGYSLRNPHRAHAAK